MKDLSMAAFRLSSNAASALSLTWLLVSFEFGSGSGVILESNGSGEVGAIPNQGGGSSTTNQTTLDLAPGLVAIKGDSLVPVAVNGAAPDVTDYFTLRVFAGDSETSDSCGVSVAHADIITPIVNFVKYHRLSLGRWLGFIGIVKHQ
jgi:hypothetical protein